MDDVSLEKILRAVECVPAGQAATYGDIAQLTGQHPRLIGNVLAQWASRSPWWRICNARGIIPGHFRQALPHWKQEGMTLNRAGTGIVLAAHRIDPLDLERLWQQALVSLE